MSASGWIGVDLDGTLATFDYWRGPEHIGEPIGPMVDRVKKWLAEGRDVRIFTARAWYDGILTESHDRAQVARRRIETWCLAIFGAILPITFKKDYHMVEFWDDRAVQVIPNTGFRADGLDREAA